MIIVLEGPDLAGKSTIAEALRGRYGARVESNGPPPAGIELYAHYSQQIAAAVCRLPVITVFDRLHVGELVYGPIFRRRTQLSALDMENLEQELDVANAIKLHVDADNAALLERLASRGDPLISAGEQLLRIAEQYRDILRDQGTYGGWKSLESNAALSYVALSLGSRPLS